MFTGITRLSEKIAHRIGVEPGNFIGVCLAIASGLALMGNGAIGKHLGQEMHPFVVAFVRSLMMTLVLFPWFMRKDGYARLRPSSHIRQIINGTVFTGAVLCWFWALPRVQLDLLAAIGFTSQIYAIVGAILFLGETARLWRWMALLVGFVGAMIILRPGFVEMTPGIIATIASAILFSTNRLLVKTIATKDNPETSVVWMAFWASVMLLPFMIPVWEMPNGVQWLWLIAISALTIVSHFCLAWALRLADIGAVEPTTFMRLIWGALLGFVFFDEIPDPFTVIGGVIVVASVIYIARRERQEGKERMTSAAG
ncbi:MAG: DMT family transporter [Rhodospirillaceae bacterium]|jgi:drug/metabolite transporter (DMT)-like permease